MSNIVPPLLSNSPPPMVGAIDEDEEDEFGDFAVATDLSYGCDALSLPSSPRKSPKEDTNKSISNHCNDTDTSNSETANVKNNEKDFQDRRKFTESDERVGVSETSIDEEDKNVNSLKFNSNIIKPNTANKYNSFQYFPEIPPDILPENTEEEFADVEDQLDEYDDFQNFASSKNDSGESNTNNNTKCVINGKNTVEGSNIDPACDFNVNPEDTEIGFNDYDKLGNDKGTSDNVDVNQTETVTTDTSEITVLNDVANHSESSDVQTVDTEVVDQNTKNDPSEEVVSKDEDIAKDSISSKFETLDIKEQPPPIQSIADEVSSEDEFGDFENHAVELSQTKVEQVEGTIELDSEWPSGNNSDDDFGDFEAPVTELKLPLDEDPFNKTKPNTSDEVFGNFDSKVFEESIQTNVGENFGDFSNFPSEEEPKLKAADTNGEDDEFGDFNDYSLQTQTSQTDIAQEAEGTPQFQRSLSLDVQGIPQRAEQTIVEMFPVIEQTTEEYQQENGIKDNSIFEALKDVTDTSALSYQWSKSNSQNFLLISLNIDTRNILYGPRWNESMPRYAATLGFSPLEPVKSETLTPSPAEPSSSPSPSQAPSSDPVQQTDIPSAQFDWVGSGLTNPLEMTPKKIVEKRETQQKDNKINDTSILTASILTKSSEINPKTAEFEFTTLAQSETNVNLQGHPDSESVKSLQFHDEMQVEESAKKSQNDDFATFQSTSKVEEENSSSPNWSFNNQLPLRETHISNCNTSETRSCDTSQIKPEKALPSFEEPGWLKPTILTPDLPRKQSIAAEEFHEEEDEFSDFQASQPAKSNATVSVPKEAESVQPNPNSSNTPTQPKLHNDDDEDEFSDFQSTLPNSHPTTKSTVPPKPLQPSPVTLEPLKPSILQPTISVNAPTSINWPDPGITEDDLRHIELFYKPNKPDTNPKELAESQEVDDNSNKTLKDPASTASREGNIVDDEDWSDFVSNQKPASIVRGAQQLNNKTTNLVKQPSRTSTPELQLSVPQLNHIQPPKKPVPIITQQGLVQTRLSSHLPISIEPLVKPSVPTYSQTNPIQNGYQPSLISNQYAIQLGHGLLHHSANTNFYQNNPVHRTDVPKQTKQDVCSNTRLHQYFSHPQPVKPSPIPVSSDKMEEFDDEWSDFVSSQPAASSQQPIPPPSMISNGLPRSGIPKPNFDWNRPPQFTSWSTNATPNIITNPVSFDTFQSFSSPAHSDLLKNKSGNRKNPSVVVQPKKNTVPSISTVPDLEFIAPKNRTWKK